MVTTSEHRWIPRHGSGVRAPAWVPFLCSYMWASQEPSWPCIWPNSEKLLVSLGWLAVGPDHIENYLAFRRLVLSIDDDPAAVEDKLWWVDHNFPGLDPTLVARCEAAVQWNISLAPAPGCDTLRNPTMCATESDYQYDRLERP